MKKYFLLFLLFLSFSGFAQQSINNYKYVLVPERFSFLKQDDQYKLNTLSKRLLEDKGFSAYFDNADLLTAIANNKCTALTFEVTAKNTMFTTGLTILLKDCKGNVLFKSKEGKSREKDYNVSYNLALREAFESLTETPYAYVEATTIPAPQSTSAATQQTTAVAAVPVAASVTNTTATVSNTAAAVAPASTAVAATASPALTTPAPTSPSGKTEAETAVTASAKVTGTLYAQPIASGFQLIDTAPKIVLTLLKTSVENSFIGENGALHGIVYKTGNTWFFEYYQSGTLTKDKLSIKF